MHAAPGQVKSVQGLRKTVIPDHAWTPEQTDANTTINIGAL